MGRRIVLATGVRVFKRLGGDMSTMITRAEVTLPAGTILEVGDPETRGYDHKDKQVLPFRLSGLDRFLLVEEVEEPSTSSKECSRYPF